MDKRTWALIDLDRLRVNYRTIKKKVGDKTKILAAVKADAYGHGAIECSRVLKQEGVDMLGVASLDEAYTLKKIGLPIVILSPSQIDEIEDIVENKFIPTITNMPFAQELQKQAHHRERSVRINIEIDTGMGRTGVPVDDAIEFVQKISQFRNIQIDGIFTHFAEAEKEDKKFTLSQIDKFERVIEKIRSLKIEPVLIHTANSAAILNIPFSHFNMVRPGMLLYGLYPSRESSEFRVKSKELKDKKFSTLNSQPSTYISVSPILSLYTRVCQIKWIDRGTSVSYGRTYIADKRKKIAVISAGYGDGYPRHLSNKGFVVLKGKRAKIVGTVCMDLTMVDITDIDTVNIGDKVTLIGEGMSCSQLASLADTINYEIITNICPRVPRVYIENGKPTTVKSILGEKNIP